MRHLERFKLAALIDHGELAMISSTRMACRRGEELDTTIPDIDPVSE